MNPLQAGKLDQRIKLQTVRTGTGPLGEPLPASPVTVATVWAKAEAVSDRKIRMLDQQQVVETWLFTIRSRTDVSIDWKVSWQSGTYTVVAVDRSHADRVELKAERDSRHD